MNLLIIFAKNIKLGKVKTRLAKTIGGEGAFEVYKHLVEMLERTTSKITNCDIHIYFSDVIIEEKWPNQQKFVQKGDDLGERMFNALKNGFDAGYSNVVGVGTDIPDLDEVIIQNGFDALQKNDTVFGPAEDGGYYLIGMNQLLPFVFENKPWSTEGLLDLTIEEIEKKAFLVKS
ncbi:MAG: TIGR04282 family arsenosugar biosynthesis glycosyltransferase [Fluviicola sp.]|nr:TIGR04282 family arsenosugar biosynthesis glycosyltransferase [Fluviicola sp.]